MLRLQRKDDVIQTTVRTCLLAAVLFVPLTLISVARSADAPAEGDWAKAIVPRGYVCYRARSPIKVDGKDDDPAWADAPWTDDFVDIEGSARPAPRFRTRARLLWDDRYLYVFAQLQEPHVWGTLTKKNDIIFRDPDFEVFIDPDGDNRNYYEFEMNALNTIWELTLDRPYRDGGLAHLGTNLDGLRSAVHVDGTLNNPADTDRAWSVEIAFPWSGLAKYAGAMPCPPADGQQWRMGFSRVEWIVDIIDGKYHKIPKEMRPEDNWVWSPQGVIDMHRPERWGYVQFSTAAPGTVAFRPDPTLRARDRLMELYYRQKELQKKTGRYATSLQAIGMQETDPAEPGLTLAITPAEKGFLATASLRTRNGAMRTLHLREDSKLWEEGGE